MPAELPALWGVYLLRCADGTLYCGITNDLDGRVMAHNAGRGAKYTRGRLPISVIIFSGCILSRADALRHERHIKRLPRGQKEAYVRGLQSRSES